MSYSTCNAKDIKLLARVHRMIDELPDTACAAVAKHALDRVGLLEDAAPLATLDEITDSDPRL